MSLSVTGEKDSGSKKGGACATLTPGAPDDSQMDLITCSRIHRHAHTCMLTGKHILHTRSQLLPLYHNAHLRSFVLPLLKRGQAELESNQISLRGKVMRNIRSAGFPFRK